MCARRRDAGVLAEDYQALRLALGDATWPKLAMARTSRDSAIGVRESVELARHRAGQDKRDRQFRSIFGEPPPL